MRALVLCASGLLALGTCVLAFGATSGAEGQDSDLQPCATTNSVSGSTTTEDISTTGACSWSPPSGITSATFTLYGAQGAPGDDNTTDITNVGDPSFTPGPDGTGGQGSEVVGTLSNLNGNTNLELNVGEGGENTSGTADGMVGAGTFGGGGAGTNFGGDGGGATDIRTGSFGLSDRILVAGGGGGGGSSNTGASGGTGGGGDENGTAGTDSEECDGSGGGAGFAGDAPSPNAGVGGAGGSDVCAGYEDTGLSGQNGTAGQGGNGSIDGGGDGQGGGGGGGGYVGGGGGGEGLISDNDGVLVAGDGGGGGGSSYTGGADGIVPTSTSVTDPASPAAPNGFIRIVFSAAVVTTTAPTTTTTTTTTTSTTTTVPAAAVQAAAPTNNPVTPSSGPQLAVTGLDVWGIGGTALLLIGTGCALLALNEWRRWRRSLLYRR
jgi:hypothetical protein